MSWQEVATATTEDAELLFDTAVKIAASVEAAIARGTLGSVERLPGDRDAAAMLAVSPAPVAAP